jgi:hypothetical protein
MSRGVLRGRAAGLNALQKYSATSCGRRSVGFVFSRSAENHGVDQARLAVNPQYRKLPSGSYDSQARRIGSTQVGEHVHGQGTCYRAGCELRLC